MNKYYDNLNEEIKEYFKILEPDFPEWLNEYIDTKELLSQKYISVTCGTIYSKLFESDFFFSSLDHSVAVALIIWHFTHDKKQTLSGLFHDISTPVFKHCVDFLNGDYMTQESTEDLTSKIIKDSSEISKFLKRDKIEIEEVDNYHIYPIYNDIEVQVNEENEKELGFKTKKIARNFVKITSKLSVIYREDRTRYSMQLLADILKRLNEDNIISIEDLYKLKESEIIDIIEKSRYKEVFNIWKNAKKVKVSKEEPSKVYFVHHGAKVRYIDPLFNGTRMSKACKIAKNMIDKNLKYDMNNYVYLDFELK